MAWEVEFTDEFAAWFDGLTTAQQTAIAARVLELETEGPQLGRPTVDTLQGSRIPNLKELRISAGGALRILFVFDPRRMAVLLLGGDKTGDWSEWYKTAIPEAEAIYEALLAELKREGLL